MNKIMKYGLLMLFIVGMLSSCEDIRRAKENNYPAPNIPVPDTGTVFKVSELVEMVTISGQLDYKNDTIFKDDCSVFGIVTADETTANFYKAAFIQEKETGKAIELYMKGVTGLRIGDYVRACLKGADLGAYKGTPQIQNLDPVNVIILENGKNLDPEVTTISNIKSQYKVGELVRLENVQFVRADTAKNWAEDNDYGERTIEQFIKVGEHTWKKDGDMMVRTSSYAAFGKEHLPTGNGYLTAIVTLYNDTWQLVIRDDNADEVYMEGERLK